MTQTNLKRRWISICNDYLCKFCTKHGFIEDFDYWVGNDVGGIACVNDEYFVDMGTIRYDIDNCVPEDNFLDWYYRSLDYAELGLTFLNYESFCKGAPEPYTADVLVELQRAHKNVEQAQEELEKLMEKMIKPTNETRNIIQKKVTNINVKEDCG